MTTERQTKSISGRFELRDITKRYPSRTKERPALNGIQLRIDSGEFLAIAGPSGSGKSTLLHILGCLDTPSSGSVVIDNKLVLYHLPKETARLRREKIGFLFQDACLIPSLTVRENVEYPLTLLKQGRRERRTAADDLLAEVGLTNNARHYPNQLSGGQRQRAALARALVKQPPLVLADEPTASLDSTNAREIIALLDRINLERRTTFVFSTHDERLLDGARRVIHLRDGEIHEDRNHV